jgi:hypothetical protein
MLSILDKYVYSANMLLAVFCLFLPTARSAIGLVITLSYFHSFYLDIFAFDYFDISRKLRFKKCSLGLAWAAT